MVRLYLNLAPYEAALVTTAAAVLGVTPTRVIKDCINLDPVLHLLRELAEETEDVDPYELLNDVTRELFERKDRTYLSMSTVREILGDNRLEELRRLYVKANLELEGNARRLTARANTSRKEVEVGEEA